MSPAPREHTPETRAVPIAALVGVSPVAVARLADWGIHTLGELSDWCGPFRRLGDLIGPEQVHAFEQAVERFWADRETEATIREAFAQEVRG